MSLTLVGVLLVHLLYRTSRSARIVPGHDPITPNFPAPTFASVSELSPIAVPTSFVTRWISPKATAYASNLKRDVVSNISSELPQAVIVLNGVTQDGFPNTICAFTIGGSVHLSHSTWHADQHSFFPTPAIICSNFNTCIFTGTNVCCGSGGSCAIDQATACREVEYYLPPGSSYKHSIQSGGLLKCLSWPSSSSSWGAGYFDTCDYDCYSSSSSMSVSSSSSQRISGSSSVGASSSSASGPLSSPSSTIIMSSSSSRMSESTSTSHNYQYCRTLVIDGQYSSFECFAEYYRHRTMYNAFEIGVGYAGHTLSFTTKSDQTYSSAWNIQAMEPPMSQLTFTEVVAAIQTGDSLERLGMIHSNVPKCAGEISTKCPEFDKAAATVLYAPNRRALFCEKVANIDCPGLCMSNRQPTQWLEWVLPICTDPSLDVSYSDFEAYWAGYELFMEASYRSLFPWGWELEFNASQVPNKTSDGLSAVTICPSFTTKILAFAVNNVAVFLLSIGLSRRTVVYACTGGKCGKPGSRWWPLTALATIALHLVANTVNAILTKASPGFQDAPIGGLILLWASRPRMTWAVCLLIPIQRGDNMYFASGISALLAELVLQLVGAVYLGKTVSHAARYNYLRIGHLKYALHADGAKIMYAGSLLWACSIGLVLIRALYAFTPLGRLSTMAWKALLRHINEFYDLVNRFLSSTTSKPETDCPGVDLEQRLGQYQQRQNFQNYGNHNAVVLDIHPGRQGLNRDTARYPFADRFPSNTPSTAQLLPDRGDDCNTDDAGQVPNTQARSEEGGMEARNSAKKEKKERKKRDKAEKKGRKKAANDLRMKLTPTESKARMGFHGRNANIESDIRTILMLLVLPWIGQWLFWAGFLSIAADLYCPPKVWTNMAVWTGFSAFSVWQGASI